MDTENENQSAFSLINSSNSQQILQQPIIIQSFWSQNTSSNNSVILTLTKTHLLVRSDLPSHSDQVYASEINFDLKFQIIYLQQKNIQSKKIGIKFLIDQNQMNCFYSTYIENIQLWVFHLSKLINQRGFHQLFKPLRKLGKGNFASVYEVERITDLRRFAVKAFSKQNTFAAKNGKESLINELSIMRSLNHSNTLRLEGVFQSDNSIYVILQVLVGDQLFHRIQKNKGYFKKNQIKSFMKGLLSGLAHMHENRIMHRDLKPENIMLRDQNSMDPVIVDFGLATNADLEKYLFYRCGTPGYVAPEIVSLTQNIHIEPECDIFSAGVIFNILLTRRPLFEGTKYEQVYRNNKLMNFNLDSPIYQKLESEELQLLKKMLVKDPKQRISAIEALNHSFFDELDCSENQKIENSPKMTQISSNTPKIRKLIKF